MTTKRFIEEVSSIEYALQQGDLIHANWQVNDLLKRLRKELKKEQQAK